MDQTPSTFFTPPSARMALVPALVAAAAALALYAVTLGGSYVYDDVMLRPNPDARCHDEDPRYTHPALWSHFWTEQYTLGAVDKLYRPFTCMTFAVEYSLHGDKPWLYHMVNWLLHAAVAAAVAELARRLLGFRVAIGAGVLFAVHPVHVEAVAGLVGRAELLCTLATVAACILFLKPITPRRSAAIAACFVIAVLSKEQGILLPGILLALVPFRSCVKTLSPTSDNVARAARPCFLLFRNHGRAARATDGRAARATDGRAARATDGRAARAPESQRAIHGLIAALCLIAAAYLILREQLIGLSWDRDKLDWAANPLVRSTGGDRWLMPLVLLGRYLMLLTAPLKLSLDYGAHVIGWSVNWGQPYVYLGIAAVIAWLILTTWAICRRHWAVLFCLLGLLLSYSMISNALLLIGTIFGERLMYLPSVFFLILAAALLARLRRPALLAGAIVLLATLGSLRAFTYARLWNDPPKLYLADLDDFPQSMHLHGLVVNEYLARGNPPAARRIAEDCVKQVPDDWHSYEMCVAADLALRDYAHAEEVLARARPYPREAGMEIARLRAAVKAARNK